MSFPPLNTKAEFPLRQDVVDRIIYCFAGTRDKPTLSTCSLVCRGWLPQSQVRLLDYIKMRSQDRLAAFISALPALSARARLFICDLFFYSDSTPSISITPSRLISILNGLPRIDSLRLHEVRLDLGEGEPREHYSPRSIGTLGFFEVTNTTSSCHPVSEIAAIVSLFTDIQALNVGGFMLSWDYRRRRNIGSLEDLVVHESHRIDTACFYGFPGIHLSRLHFLLMANISFRLRTIDLSHMDAGVATAPRGLLMVIHPSKRFPDGFTEMLMSCYIPKVSTVQFPCLRTAHIDLHRGAVSESCT